MNKDLKATKTARELREAATAWAKVTQQPVRNDADTVGQRAWRKLANAALKYADLEATVASLKTDYHE